jgi:hypothetical protein
MSRTPCVYLQYSSGEIKTLKIGVPKKNSTEVALVCILVVCPARLLKSKPFAKTVIHLVHIQDRLIRRNIKS